MGTLRPIGNWFGVRQQPQEAYSNSLAIAELCELCRRQPKYQDLQTREMSRYCSRTCASHADSDAFRQSTNAHKGSGHRSGQRSTTITALRPAYTFDTGLCEMCKSRPKYTEASGFTHPFCGRTCADLAGSQQIQQNVAASPVATQQLPSTYESSIGPPTILFYDREDMHYGFTNFSDHPVQYNGRVYLTSEHLFQAFKFLDSHPEIAESIRRRKSPRGALDEAHQHEPDVCLDWFQVSIAKMDEVLRLKFEQHDELRRELLATGNALLVENSPIDPFWGNGQDGDGRNELGMALMRLRDILKRGLSVGGAGFPAGSQVSSS